VPALGSEDERDDELAEKFMAGVEQLNRDLGIPETLAALQDKDIGAIARAACKEADTYPVPRYMTVKQCEALIRKLLPAKAEKPVKAAKAEKTGKAAKPAPAKKVPAKKAARKST
jgi:hypothetical protein